MAALHRALTLAVGDDVAVRISDELDFDVAGLEQQLLEVDAVITEGARGFGTDQAGCVRQLGFLVDDADALAAAASRRLQEYGKANAARDRDQVVVARTFLVDAGNHRDPGESGDAAGRDLVAHGANGVCRGADEGDPGRRHGLGEVRVLRQEAIARVDRIGPNLLRRLDDSIDAQVGVPRRGRTEAARLVGEPHVQRVAVRVGVDRDDLDIELSRRAQHTQGDLAPIGDQQPAEHGRNV